MKYKKYDGYKKSETKWFNEIPLTWDVRPIKHLANTIPGGTPSTSNLEYWENGNIPWLPSGMVQNCQIDEQDAYKFITEKGLLNSATKYIGPESVLVALTGATCANIGFLTFKATANQSVISVEPYDSFSKYIYYALLSQREQILDKKTGGAQSGINEEDVGSILVPIMSIQEQNQIAPPLRAFPFLKIKPVIFVDFALTIHICLWFSASNIASPSPYLMKFKFILISKPVLYVPLYSPDAILIVSSAEALSIASFKDTKALASLFPSPLEVLLAFTYQLVPAVNTSSLDTFKVSVSFTIEFILLFASKLLTSLLTETISLVELSSALTAEIANKQTIIIKNKYCFFNIIFSPLKN